MQSFPPSPRARPRIAFLCDTPSRYQTRVAGGAKRAALSLGADIVCFFGGYFTDGGRASNRLDASFLYQLARAPAIDGLVVVTTVLANEVGVQYVSQFCQETGLPVVSIGWLPGFPHVLPDNESGIRAVLEHLIEDHHLKRFAFVRGSDGNPESMERESAFRAVLVEHGLPIREELILPGAFVQVSGAMAVRELFDERRVGVDEVDAIIAVNDQTALGAMCELSMRGIRIPEDVAVVGFDDDDSAALAQPALTTVHQPLERIGQQAVELLLARMQGRHTIECVRVQTAPALRRSCGCMRRIQRFSLPTIQLQPKAPPTLERLRRECRQATVPLFGVGSSATDRGSDTLVDAFSQALSGSGIDLDPFARAVSKTASDGDDPLRWLDVLQIVETELERQATLDPELVARGRWFMAQANLVVTEAAARAAAAALETAGHYDAALEVLTCALMSAEDEHALTRVLTAALPGIGLRFFCLCLFEDTQPERSRVRVLAAYDSSQQPQGNPLPGVGAWWSLAGRIFGPSANSLSSDSPVATVFSAENLLPSGLCMEDAPTFLSVHPLSFARKPLGYAVFDQPWRHGHPWAPSDVAEHLSNAVYVLQQAEHLRHARKTAEAASVAKSEFVARMSHEIRTPLTAVMGYLDLCLRRVSAPNERRYLLQAQASSRVLLGVLNDILDFSKIEAQQLEVEHTRFELEQILDQIVATCAAAAFAKNIELVLDISENVPNVLVGDPLRLTQVLVNLVGNAVKFTAQGEVVLSISHVPSDGDTTALQFCVRDTGIGIARENLNKLMVPFIQADNSTTRRFGGTGLGLAISQRLIHRMGGSLNLRSELGLGTDCSFSLEFSNPGEYPSRDELGPWPGLRVCVVDDNPASLTVVVRMLTQAGCHVITAASGEAAVELFAQMRERHESVRLLLLDQGLPGRTGSDVVRRLVELDLVGDCRILLMAPLGELEPATSLLTPEVMCGIVSKPVRRNALGAQLSGLWSKAEDTTSVQCGISNRPDAEAALSGKRVLVVQDDEINRTLVKELLQQSGIDVHVVESGVEAVQRVAEFRFDAVLMDLNLPLMDGCEATRIIRAKFSATDLPIIAVTASASVEDRKRCFDVGMNDYIQTPIDSMDLLAVLAKWIRARGGERPDAIALPVLIPPLSVGSLTGGATDPSESTNAWLDVRGALRRLRGDAALYRRLLKRFIESHRSTADLLRDSGDAESRLRLVHTQVGAAGNIGALELQRTAQALEAKLRSGSHATAEEWTHLESVLSKTIDVVAAACGNSTIPPANLPDWDRLRSDLTALATLLDQCDASATDFVDNLPVVVGSDAINEEVRRIKRAVRAYDFEGAGQRVQALVTSLQQSGL